MLICIDGNSLKPSIYLATNFKCIKETKLVQVRVASVWGVPQSACGVVNVLQVLS